MDKLISMTDFVLQFDKPAGYYEDQSDFLEKQVDFMGLCMNYAEFLKTPLNLGMFVPCDEEGEVLTEPDEDNYAFYTHKNLSVQEEWQQAKDRVLFEGYQTKGGIAVAKAICATYKVIEDLTHKKIPLVDLVLTATAKKIIKL